MLWTSRLDPVFLMRRRLIASMGRRGLRPVFDPNVLERMALIALGQSGFALDEIALMFAPDGRPRIDREIIAAKAEGLRHASACRAAGTWNVPRFAASCGPPHLELSERAKKSFRVQRLCLCQPKGRLIACRNTGLHGWFHYAAPRVPGIRPCVSPEAKARMENQ